MFDVQWPLVLFSFLAGTGGLTLASAALSGILGKGSDNSRFIASILGIVLMIVGGCCSMLHLAVVENVMAAATNIFSFSGISIELILLGLSCIIAVIYAIVLKRETSDGARKAVAILCIIAGVLLAFFCGHGYVMDGRPLWNIELLPLAYLGTSFSAGSLLFAVIQITCKEPHEDICALRGWIIAGTLAGLVTVAIYVMFLGMQSALNEQALAYALLAIVGALVAVGCALCFLRSPAVNVQVLAIVGLIGALIAGICLRMLMWAVSSGYLELFNVAMTTREWMF